MLLVQIYIPAPVVSTELVEVTSETLKKEMDGIQRLLELVTRCQAYLAEIDPAEHLVVLPPNAYGNRILITVTGLSVHISGEQVASYLGHLVRDFSPDQPVIVAIEIPTPARFHYHSF